ncbi:MAG: GNAT family protein [Pseudomonadota bacterium]
MVPLLKTDRLILRALAPSDAGPLQLYASDLRVARMTTSIPHPYPPGAAEALIAASLAGKTGETVWALDATPSDGTDLVGLISYRPSATEIGYWVGPPFWNTGFATEAVEALIAHLFGGGHAERLVERVFSDNLASAQVLWKCGFQESGTTQCYSVARAEAVTARLFTLDRAQWAARQRRETAAE